MVLTGVHFFGGSKEKSVSLPFSLSRGCLHVLACGFFPDSNHITPTSASVVTSSLTIILTSCFTSLVAKESAYNAGDPGSIPKLGRSPGEGNNNPLQYSCLGNPMDRGAWRATVHQVTKESNTTERFNNNQYATKDSIR